MDNVWGGRYMGGRVNRIAGLHSLCFGVAYLYLYLYLYLYIYIYIYRKIYIYIDRCMVPADVLTFSARREKLQESELLPRNPKPPTTALLPQGQGIPPKRHLRGFRV